MKDKILEYLFWGALIIGIGLVFVFSETIMNFFDRLLSGWKGSLVMLGVAVWITLLFAFVFGYRGKSLAYLALVAVVVCLAIWFYINMDFIFEWLEATIGIWGAIGIGVVLIAVGWFILHFLF